MNKDLISREWLYKEFKQRQNAALRWKEKAVLDDDEERKIRADATLCFLSEVKLTIDNAPTVEVPENEVNCVLTMFGKCSYNKTGCSDCEIKEKIRKALNERPQGEWIFDGVYREENNPIDNDVYHCNLCKRSIMTSITRPTDLFPFCHCGADMRK